MTTNRSPGEWNLAVRQQAAVAHLGQFGLRTEGSDEVLQEALVVAADTLGVTEVALFELSPAGDELSIRVAMRDGRVIEPRHLAKVRLPVGRSSLPGFALLAGEPVVTEDLIGDHRFQAQAPQFGVPARAALAAPIAWDRTPFGVLAVYDLDLRRWTDDEVHFVQSIASTMGLALQRGEIEHSLRDSSTRLDLSLQAGGLGAWSWQVDAGRVHLSNEAQAMYGLGTDAADEPVEQFLALVHPDDRPSLRELALAATEVGRELHLVYRIIRHDNGEVRWIETWGRTLDAVPGARTLVGVCSDVTDRRRADEVREALLAREHAARIEAEAARERLAFLAEASGVLSASLEPEVTISSFADLCVPTVADVCFIDLVDEDGLLAEQVARAATEPLLHDGQALRRRRAELGADAPRTGHELAVDGKPVLYPEITDKQLVDAAVDASHLALLQRYDARSTVLVPLVTRGRVIGVVTLVRTGSRPAFDADDLALIEELAGRAALAIDNGRLFHSRNRVARSLQSALLPPALPAVAGLALAARYDVAETDVAIGGDFYDVIAIAAGTWAVVVGDVCGRGPDAAALTGLVRHTLRTAVVREQVPSRVLQQTNAAVIQQIDDAKFCTAAFLRVEVGDPAPGHARVTAASAGHPRPVLVRAAGGAEVLDCAGTLLGVVDEVHLIDVVVALAPGDAIVLYTDGVTEARRGAEQFGEGRLLQTLGALAGRSADEMAGGLEEAVASFRRSARDDTAILVVQAVGPA